MLGLIGYALSFLIGILFLEPEGKRIHSAMEAAGPDSPRAAFHVRRINVVSRMERVILYLVVAVMALKPTGEDTGTLIVGAAVVLATLAVGLPRLRADAVAETPATAD